MEAMPPSTARAITQPDIIGMMACDVILKGEHRVALRCQSPPQPFRTAPSNLFWFDLIWILAIFLGGLLPWHMPLILYAVFWIYISDLALVDQESEGILLTTSLSAAIFTAVFTVSLALAIDRRFDNSWRRRYRGVDGSDSNSSQAASSRISPTFWNKIRRTVPGGFLSSPTNSEHGSSASQYSLTSSDLNSKASSFGSTDPELGSRDELIFDQISDSGTEVDGTSNTSSEKSDGKSAKQANEGENGRDHNSTTDVGRQNGSKSLPSNASQGQDEKKTTDEKKETDEQKAVDEKKAADEKKTTDEKKAVDEKKAADEKKISGAGQVVEGGRSDSSS